MTPFESSGCTPLGLQQPRSLRSCFPLFFRQSWCGPRIHLLLSLESASSAMNHRVLLRQPENALRLRLLPQSRPRRRQRQRVVDDLFPSLVLAFCSGELFLSHDNNVYDLTRRVLISQSLYYFALSESTLIAPYFLLTSLLNHHSIYDSLYCIHQTCMTAELVAESAAPSMKRTRRFLKLSPAEA